MIGFLLAVLAGWLLADFLSGLLHWLEDRIAGDRWPILGPLVFAPNRLHHEQPLAFTRASFAARNGTSIVAALILFATIATTLVLMPAMAVPGLVWVLLISATIAGALANQIHYWAHMPHRAPGIVQALQTIGLCQSRWHHARHHAPPQRERYCILTNWLNPWLDQCSIWAMLERRIPRHLLRSAE